MLLWYVIAMTVLLLGYYELVFIVYFLYFTFLVSKRLRIWINENCKNWDFKIKLCLYLKRNGGHARVNVVRVMSPRWLK